MYRARHNLWVDSGTQPHQVASCIRAWGFGVHDEETGQRGLGAVIHAGDEVREISRVIPPADPAPHRFFRRQLAHLEAMLAVLQDLAADRTLVYCCGSGHLLNGLAARCYAEDDDLPTAPLFAEVGQLLHPFPRVVLQFMEHPAPMQRAVGLARLVLATRPRDS